MKKKRILFFDHTSQLSGGERSLLLILKGINKEKFKPILVTPEQGSFPQKAALIGIETGRISIPKMVLERKRKKIGVLFLIFSFFMSLSSVFRLLFFIKKKRIDIIYTNSQKAHLIGLFAGLLAGVPVIWHFRDILNNGTTKQIVRVLGVLFTKNIIAISRVVAEQFGMCDKKVRLVYNAIDVSDFERRKRDVKTDLREEYGLPRDSKIVASVGQIAEWKGLKYLVYSAKELVKVFDNLYFFIVGKPFFKEIGYSVGIQNLVKLLSLQKRLFFTGFRKDVPGIMDDIDILLHTPIEPEPFGRVIIEAMAAGTVVVAFDNGAIGEILSDGTGLLVSPFDIEGLTQGISTLLKDRALYKKIAEKSVDYVRARFDSPLLISRIEKILED